MRRVLSGALVACAGLAGCVEDDGSVFIEGVIPIDRDTECVANAASIVFVNAGSYDLAPAAEALQGYTAALKVRTNLPSTFTTADLATSRGQAPNYPNYGPTDNNIVIFESATVNFTFVTTDPAVIAAATNGGFTCDAETNVCTGEGSRQLISGSVFNLNTAIGSASAVFLEAFSAAEAAKFKEIFSGSLEGSSKKSQRIVAEMSVQGVTTGSGSSRPVKSFPYPFSIDLCVGCLNPSNEFCEGLETAGGLTASKVLVEELPCIEGQDALFSVCWCTPPGGVPGVDGGPALDDKCG
jgi:hypothetical protein